MNQVSARPRRSEPEHRLRLSILLLLILAPAARGQDEELVVRPGPPAREDFETDEDGDGIPDGWYNLRDATWTTGGAVGPHCLRMENDRPGFPARASRAFGVDGRKTEALIVGVWVRLEDVVRGERTGENPGQIIDYLGAELRFEGRGTLGPWTNVEEGRWLRSSRRIPVPLGSRDAILSVGLFGATGVMEVDGLTIEEVPRGGSESTDLVLNGGFELGDLDPAHWSVTGGGSRTFPGHESDSALELSKSSAMAQAAVAVPVARLGELEVRLAARGSGLRGSGGATAALYFVDEKGSVLPGNAAGALLFRFAGSFDWRSFRKAVRIPFGAAGAVLQLDKTDSAGWIRFDDVAINASPDPSRGAWTPYHVTTDTEGWRPFEPADAIEPGSALDASGLLDAPAGSHGFVQVKDGHFNFEKGGPARFFGVVLLPPLQVPTPERADALADNLARRGVNLVRFDDLDIALGPGRSLLDDASPDTASLDPRMLERFDHLVAALKKRGIYVSLELIAARLLRQADPVPGASALPPGGGPAAAFDPRLRELTLTFARDLLNHVNPETGLALKDDPVLAWVTISGEQSLFDLLDNPQLLPPKSEAELRKLADSGHHGTGRRLWQSLESEQWQAIADDLRKLGLRVPIAGASHWRREPEFNAAQAVAGLDLIDDRLYWPPSRFAQPDRRSALWDTDGNLRGEAARKRRSDHAYAVSQWCAHTEGAWALPFEAADLLLMAETTVAEDWDALVRRGIFLHPERWGAAAPGTSGDQDTATIPEALNANPAAFAMLPHAASIILRGAQNRTVEARRLAAWDSGTGRLIVSTPHTQALAGWAGRRPATFDTLSIEFDSPYAAVAVSSLDPDPIATSRRLLITAVARVEPTGLTYADALHHEVADPGRPPLLVEPVRARVTLKRRGQLRAFALDPSGRRLRPAELETIPDGVRLVIDGESPILNWEIIEAGAAPAPP